MNTSTIGLTIDPKSKDDKYYLTCWISFGNNVSYVFLDNIRITDESDMRLVFWCEEGEVKFHKICKEPKAWRMGPYGNIRNYPPGFGCTHCGQSVQCTPGCA